MLRKTGLKEIGIAWLVIAMSLPVVLHLLGYSISQVVLPLLGQTVTVWAGALLGWQSLLLSMGIGLFLGGGLLLVGVALHSLLSLLVDTRNTPIKAKKMNIPIQPTDSVEAVYHVFSGVEEARHRMIDSMVYRDQTYTRTQFCDEKNEISEKKLETILGDMTDAGTVSLYYFDNSDKIIEMYTYVSTKTQGEVFQLRVTKNRAVFHMETYGDLKQALSQQGIEKGEYARYHYAISSLNVCDNGQPPSHALSTLCTQDDATPLEDTFSGPARLTVYENGVSF